MNKENVIEQREKPCNCHEKTTTSFKEVICIVMNGKQLIFMVGHKLILEFCPFNLDGVSLCVFAGEFLHNYRKIKLHVNEKEKDINCMIRKLINVRILLIR